MFRVLPPLIGHSHLFVFFFLKKLFFIWILIGLKKKGKKCFVFFWFCFHKISDPVSLISLYSDCVTKRKKKTHWRLNPSPVNMSRFEIFQFFGFPPFYFILLFFCPIFSPICLFIFSSKFPVVKKKKKNRLWKKLSLFNRLSFASAPHQILVGFFNSSHLLFRPISFNICFHFFFLDARIRKKNFEKRKKVSTKKNLNE